MKPKRVFVPRYNDYDLSYIEFFEDGYNYYFKNGELRDFTFFNKPINGKGWSSLENACASLCMLELTGQELLEFEAEWVLKR